MIGKTISHYEIQEELGRGGMGVVYRALDTTLKRNVALKFLPAELTRDEDARKRFTREAQAAAALDHPNICTVYEVGQSEGHTFIAMQLIEGQSLRDRLESGPLPIDEAMEWTIQVGRGLSKAHGSGIVHRDIKPGNVLLTEEGQAKVVDFGLAKLGTQTRLTRTGTMLGTVSYMSPEQARGDEVDHRTDVWALGAVLYEMLAGTMPFRGEYEPAVIYSIMNEEPEPVTAKRKEVPVGLEDVVERALAKDPEKRYQSVVEMLSALEMVREESRLGIERRGRAAFKRFARRKRLLAALAAMAVLAIAAVLITTFYESGQALDSIAVLPLENLSGDESQDIFADGITGELIANFSRVGSFKKVISRSASMRYRDTEKSPREIARELNVKAVVGGMIQIQGDNVRITTELIDGNTEELIWSETFNGRMVDILKLQGQIARRIAREVRVTLTPTEERMLTVEREVDPEVYKATLLGHEKIELWERGSWKEAVEHFQQAISMDSTYAPAYAGLGIAYTNMARYGDARYTTENRRKATGAALKAIELDETSAEAHSALGKLYLDMNFNWEQAERAHKRAVELNPTSITLGAYAAHLGWAGRFDEAIAMQRTVIELDTKNEWQALQLGFCMLCARRYEDAIDQYLSILEWSPDYSWAKLQLAWVYLNMGRYEEADSIRIELGGQFDAWELARMGRAEEALAIVDRWDNSGYEKFYAYLKARTYACLGDKEKALEMLEEALMYTPESLLAINTDPEFDFLRPDPRFQDLMRRAGIPSGELAGLEKQ